MRRGLKKRVEKRCASNLWTIYMPPKRPKETLCRRVLHVSCYCRQSLDHYFNKTRRIKNKYVQS